MTQPVVVVQPLLKAGQTVTQEVNPLPRPTLTFATDETTGPYISEIRLGSIVFQFDPTVLLKVGLWNVSGAVAVELDDADDFTVTTSLNELTGAWTVTVSLVAYTGVSFAFTLSPLAEGFQVGMVTTSTSSTHAIEWCEFPRLGCKPPSETATNGWLAHGFCGGLVITDPYNTTLGSFGDALEAPPNMQFFDYYDIDTKAHLYISFDDEDGYRKQHQLIGDGSMVAVQGFRHFYPNPRRTANGGAPTMPYTHTYHTNIEVFRGMCADGRMGCYDSAIRYRSFGTSSSRSWMVDGPWNAASNVSDLIKDSDFYYVRLLDEPPTSGTPHTDIVEDMIRVKDYIGATHMVGLLYGWANNMDFADSFFPPAFAPLAPIASGDLNTALGNAAADNVHLSVYIIPQWWMNELTGVGNVPFRFDDFIGTIDYNGITQYVLRDNDDNAQTGENLGQAPPILVEP